MDKHPNWRDERLASTLRQGGLAVMPTDTVYGIVARALDQRAVERAYAARRRNPDKPCIILVSDVSDLEKFSIPVSEEQKEKLAGFWPGPVSVILDCPGEEFAYLHRGTHSLAFRLPAPDALRALLALTGPLIAPSANPEGLPTAKTVAEAREYFGDSAEYYADGGEISGRASRVLRLSNGGEVSIIRE